MGTDQRAPFHMPSWRAIGKASSMYALLTNLSSCIRRPRFAKPAVLMSIQKTSGAPPPAAAVVIFVKYCSYGADSWMIFTFGFFFM